MSKSKIGYLRIVGNEWWPPRFDSTQRNIMQAAYGIEFSESSWQELLEIFLMFIIASNFERNAPTASLARQSLEKFRKAAVKFEIALEVINDEVVVPVIRDIVQANSNTIYHAHSFDIDEFDQIKAMTATAFDENEIEIDYDFVSQLLLEIKELTKSLKSPYNFEGKNNGFNDFDAWRALVRDLMDWAKFHGLPSGVSKDVDDVSPFVRFMAALQTMMPTSYRRHTQSLPALATGVSRAIAEAKEEHGADKKDLQTDN